MKKLVLIILVHLSALAGFSQSGIHCGTERWDVKTLSDPDTTKIDFNNIVLSSVHEQVGLKAPNVVKDVPRGKDESIVYKIYCKILGFKAESDKDIHIVIEDPNTNATMIAEIPSPDCQGIQGTSRVAQFTDLNQWFIDNIGQPTKKFHNLKETVNVVLTGVGFFDFNHGQTGRADNGREIHPVLTMELSDEKAAEAPFVRQTPTPPASETTQGATIGITPTDDPVKYLCLLLIASLLGGLGQFIRILPTINTLQTKTLNSTDVGKDINGVLDNLRYMLFTILIAMVIGALAGIIGLIGSKDFKIDSTHIMLLIAAGYAGTDLIEKFIIKK
jgi:hypothetical protein